MVHLVSGAISRFLKKMRNLWAPCLKTIPAYRGRKRTNYGLYHPLAPGSLLEFTCGHCQFVCHPDKAVRKARYKMITDSGVVIQEADGTLRAVSPEAAEKHISAMSSDQKSPV